MTDHAKRKLSSHIFEMHCINGAYAQDEFKKY